MDLTLAICVYNAEKYIEETLQSVISQTMQDFHLLIVDDCSTDSSAEKVTVFFTDHPRQYELIRFSVNGGICHARHYAECHASTEYMMFLDADDILLPEAIGTMYGKITSNPDLIAVGCHLDYIDRKGKRIGGGIYLGDETKEAFRKRAGAGKLIFMQPTAIYDRAAALSVGGYDELGGGNDGRTVRWQDYCEDLDLWTRMSDLYKDGKAIVVIPRVLCHYRKADSGMSANSFNMMVKMKYVKNNVSRRRAGGRNITFDEFYGSLPADELSRIRRDADAADSLRHGVFCIRRLHICKGLKLLIRSVILRPGYIIGKLKHNIKW